MLSKDYKPREAGVNPQAAELEAAVAQFEKMLATTEAAVANGNINTAGTESARVLCYLPDYFLTTFSRTI